METFKVVVEQFDGMSGVDVTCSPDGVIAATIFPRMLPKAFYADAEPMFRVEYVGATHIRDEKFVRQKAYDMLDSLLAKVIKLR